MNHTTFIFIFIVLLLALGILVILLIFKRSKVRYKNALESIHNQKYDEAIQILKLLIENNSTNPFYFYNLGKAYYYSEQPELAIKELNQALEIDYNDVLANEIVYNYIINSYKSIENFDGLKNIYLKAINLFPENDEYKIELAELYYKHKKPEDSLEMISKIQNQDSIAEKIILLNAKNHILLNKKDKAIHILSKLINKFPNNAEGHYLLGSLYRDKQNYINGIDILVQGLKISTGELKYKILMNLIHLFLDTEEFEIIIENIRQYYTEFKNEQKKSLHLNYYLGLAYKKTGDIKSSQKYLSKVYKANPEFKNVKKILGISEKIKKLENIEFFLKNLSKEKLNHFILKLVKNFNLHLHKIVNNSPENINVFCSETSIDKFPNIVLGLRIWRNKISDMTITNFLNFIMEKKLKHGYLVLTCPMSKTAKQLSFKLKKEIDIIDNVKLKKIIQKLISDGEL